MTIKPFYNLMEEVFDEYEIKPEEFGALTDYPETFADLMLDVFERRLRDEKGVISLSGIQRRDARDWFLEAIEYEYLAKEYSERHLALAKHLGMRPSQIEESRWDEREFEVEPREMKWGEPPSYWKERGERLREMLSQVGPEKTKWQDWHEIAGWRQRYDTVKHMLFEKGSVTFDTDLSNNLFHLLSDDDPDRHWHAYAIRAAFNGEEIEDRREPRHASGGEYLVLTDDEADERVSEYIKESLWAFRPSFLSGKTGMPEVVFEALQPRYEDANEALLSIVNSTCGMHDFVEAAVGADGRGHFLDQYDGEEWDVYFNGETYYIYRTN